jgi:hypothetical protein
VRGTSTSTPLNTVISQPVIDRAVETMRAVDAGGVSSADLDARLPVFAQDFTRRLQHGADTSYRQDVIISDSIGDVVADDLDGRTIAGSSWTGGTIANATITSINTNTLASAVAIANGGTVTTTAPTHRQLLLDNHSAATLLVSTSSLGIASR